MCKKSILINFPHQQFHYCQIAALARDVQRCEPVGHGHVGVGARLQQHLCALLAPRLLDPGGDVQGGLADLAACTCSPY